MALQDLSPQLRTRLNRMERAVGWFVILATLLLLGGFAYYIYNTAESKGWFLKKISYRTGASSAAGLKIGDPVRLMGRDVGDITDVILNEPYAYYNVTIQFRVKMDQYNYPGYIWSDSKVKINSGDFLGNRYLEITKGVEGVPTVRQSTNSEILGVLRSHHFIKTEMQALQKDGKTASQALAMLNAEAKASPEKFYTNRLGGNYFFLEPLDSPALSDQLESVAKQIETALPNILNLTNQIAVVLSNTASLTANLDAVASGARPAVSNLTFLTAQLNHPGALGEWLLPTNINTRLDTVLGGVDVTLTNVNTNLAALAENVNLSLENLAGITSNLNAQVQANSNMLGVISKTVSDADDFVQGLKRHWLLRSAFKKENKAAQPAK